MAADGAGHFCDSGVALLLLRHMDQRLVPRDGTAESIVNMRPSREGTLATVVGPAPFLPALSTSGIPAQPVPPGYFGEVLGVFAAEIGRRRVTLIQDDDSIRAYQGWSRSWGDGGAGGDCVIGPSSRTPLLESDLGEPEGPSPPPQWVAVPNGVVIIPTRGRAYFFDGDHAAPLGYQATPSSPIGLGPVLQRGAGTVSGFNHRGEDDDTDDFGFGRKGTVEVYPGSAGFFESGAGQDGPAEAGRMLPGSFRAEIRWIDRWGNLSPSSPPSAAVMIPAEDSHNGSGDYFRVDELTRYLAWTALSIGPDATVGRILAVSPDERHAGSTVRREFPAALVGGVFAFANIPDNESWILPDNAPDAWLGPPMPPVVPVPEFRAACAAFGRLWVVAVDGRVWWSEPGLWGTFLQDSWAHPDPRALPLSITSTPHGVLVLGPRGAHVFREVGAAPEEVPGGAGVAVDTPRVLPDGTVVWFSGVSFQRWDGQVVVDVGAPVAERLRRANRARWGQATAAVDPETGEYLCAVAEDSDTTGGTIYAYSDGGWRLYTGVVAVRQFCTVPDSRRMVLIAGTARGRYQVGATTTTSNTRFEGVWCWARETAGFIPVDVESSVVTNWIGVEARDRKRAMYAHLWLRETDTGVLTVSVSRDWRVEVVEAPTAPAYAADEGGTADTGRRAVAPAVWGTAVLGAAASVWRRRRPFWRKVSVSVNAAEVIKFKVARTGTRWEFLAVAVDAAAQVGASRTPGGGA